MGGYSIIFYVVTDGASITLGYSYWTCALNAHPLAAELFRLSLEQGPLLHTVFLLIQEGSPNTKLEYPE